MTLVSYLLLVFDLHAFIGIDHLFVQRPVPPKKKYPTKASGKRNPLVE
jgi:hypothetical protein